MPMRWSMDLSEHTRRSPRLCPNVRRRKNRSMNADQRWQELTRRMAELRDLSGAIALMSWDQETMMPAGGAEARAEQLATLQGILHERLTAPVLGEHIEALGAAEGERRAILRALRFDRDRAAKIPGRLVRELAE